jgi:A/G-specific adenine glycosylase
MAQQTQVERVGERWAAFLEAFPTVGSLASASPADVLRAWAGLGYNRRGLNLWRAARLIVERHDGVVPDEPDVLAELPGIGPYTARAVAAIAFGRPVGAVDTNVRRVLSRVAFGDRGGSAKQLQLLADEAVPADRPADWTHALMDFGAAFCRARPRCHACPVAVSCRFAAQGRDAAGPAPRDRARAARPFEETSRWLRGRILARLRDASGAAWTTFGVPIGVHDRDRVAVALATLAREGLVELHPRRSDQARLPLS